MKLETRETWLIEAAKPLAKLIADAGFAMPDKVRYTCGWPSRGGLGKKKRTIGQCWGDTCSGDKTFEIFISPYLHKQVELLETLIHEMIHAAVGLKCGHKGNFRKCAKAVGLEGKMTATNAGKDLEKKLKDIGLKLGNYPHAKLDGRSDSGPKKQGCRQLKCLCPRCGYVIRVTRQWIDTGLPTCHCGGVFIDESGESDESDTEDNARSESRGNAHAGTDHSPRASCESGGNVQLEAASGNHAPVVQRQSD